MPDTINIYIAPVFPISSAGAPHFSDNEDRPRFAARDSTLERFQVLLLLLLLLFARINTSATSTWGEGGISTVWIWPGWHGREGGVQGEGNFEIDRMRTVDPWNEPRLRRTIALCTSKPLLEALLCQATRTFPFFSFLIGPRLVPSLVTIIYGAASLYLSVGI